jgi:hypothetical protein
MDEAQIVRLDDVFVLAKGQKFDGADISIAVEYQPWFVPWQLEKTFRFYTRKENDGKFSWVPRPLER